MKVPFSLVGTFLVALGCVTLGDDKPVDTEPEESTSPSTDTAPTHTGDSSTDTAQDSGTDPTDTTEPCPVGPCWEEGDEDHDGWTDEEGDCDDTRAATNPEEPEYCNRIDDDCNGVVDDHCWEGVVSLYSDGFITPGDGAIEAGGYSWSWYDIDSRLLCQYTMTFVDAGFLPAPECPECEWTYAVNGSRVGWSGVGCNNIDLHEVVIESAAEQAETFDTVLYIGYASTWEVERNGGSLVYHLGATMLTENDSSRDFGPPHAWTYAPWGDYEVTMDGATMTWHVGSLRDYYTYTP